MIISKNFLIFSDKLPKNLNIFLFQFSALIGKNIVSPNTLMPWYKGFTLLHILESIKIENNYSNSEEIRLPVQFINRPNSDFYGYFAF